MATVRGTIGNGGLGIQPFMGNWGNGPDAFWVNRYNDLKSVNDPLRYQMQWFAPGLRDRPFCC